MDLKSIHVCRLSHHEKRIHETTLMSMPPPQSLISKTATFEILPTNFIYALKESTTKDNTEGVCPLLCTIPDSPRYKDGKKPVPRKNTNVSLAGYLTSVTRETGAQKALTHFNVQVESICLLGHLSVPNSVPTPKTTGEF